MDGMVSTSGDWFRFHHCNLEGVIVVERQPVSDSRGDFARLFSDEDFKKVLLNGQSLSTRQVNLSRNTSQGTVRGLHLLHAAAREYKLVTCVAGSVWDVAVDLRPQSKSLGMYFAIELRSGQNRSLLVPPGVAHGFQALEANSTVLYMHSQPYQKELDGGVRADDPALAIDWPLPISARSDRDVELPSFEEYLSTVA